MRRGLRYLPVVPKGRRRIGLLAIGLLASMSLVWQQQATLASFTDAEFSSATFTAAKLEPVTPEFTTTAATATGTWEAASGSWATPAYRLNWSASGNGSGTNLYSGPNTTATHANGTGTPSAEALAFTDVAAGNNHACGVSQGTVYCWGTSSNGALGRGTESPIATPKPVTGGQLGTKAVAAVTAGNDFTCARAVDGTAYCWGQGGSGQLGNGGQQSQNTPRQVSNLNAVTTISAGDAHACAVSGGSAYCWGSGANGRLGNGAVSGSQASPALVTTSGSALAGRIVAGITAGGAHSCAVADGMAFCWGRNDYGQVGDNSTTNPRATAVAVATNGVLMGRSVTRISAGANHTCAIADAKAFCWGLGDLGRLGNSAATTSQVPVAVTTTTMSGKLTEISSGSTHTCAIASGNAFCWGAGASYGLGNNNTGNQTAPVATGGSLSDHTVTAISAGSNFGCAVAAGRPASCWGAGSSYRLGDNSTENNRIPAHVSLTSPACPDGSVRTSATTCSLVQGTDYYYRLGYSIGTWDAPDSEWVKATTKTRDGVDPELDSRTATSITLRWDAAPEPGQSYPEYRLQRSVSADHSDPVTLTVTGNRGFTDAGGLDPTRDFTEVAAGEAHSCGIVGDDLYCWGFNQYGQLGRGNTTASSVPVKVAALEGKKVTAVTAGQSHSCAIADGKAYCWGRADSGQLGNGSGQTQTSPVLVSNQSGLTASAVSAGANHTCAIANGSAYCWGLNNNGQLGNGATANSNVPVAVSTSGELGSRAVVSIAAGGAHTCAVADNNRAYCWGFNSSSQLGSRYCALDFFGLFCLSYDNRDRTTSVAVEASGDLTTGTTSITAGSAHTCAIAANKAYCWGRGDSGQLGSGSSPASTRTPQTVSTGTMSGSVARITAGSNHTCAIAANKAYCWGLNGNSQLGNGGTGNANAPVAVTANGALKDANITSLAAGTAHGCLVSGGAAYCWGSGDNGRLGNRTTAAIGPGYPVAVLADARCAPESVALGNGTCSLAAGSTYRYRITYTLDGNTTTRGGWVAIKTSG